MNHAVLSRLRHFAENQRRDSHERRTRILDPLFVSSTKLSVPRLIVNRFPFQAIHVCLGARAPAAPVPPYKEIRQKCNFSFQVEAHSRQGILSADRLRDLIKEH